MEHKNIFIINAHGSIPHIEHVQLPPNAEMVTPLPGFSIPQPVSNGLFARFTHVQPPEFFSAQTIFATIKQLFNNEGAEYYADIYNSSNMYYTDTMIEFKLLLADQDDGDILSIHIEPSHIEITRFRDIPHLKESIFAQFPNQEGTYQVKLSLVIQAINTLMGGNPFLLVVCSCAYMGDEIETQLNLAAAKERIPVEHIKQVLKDEGYLP
jgi:hypothetical protein